MTSVLLRGIRISAVARLLLIVDFAKTGSGRRDDVVNVDFVVRQILAVDS